MVHSNTAKLTALITNPRASVGPSPRSIHRADPPFSEYNLFATATILTSAAADPGGAAIAALFRTSRGYLRGGGGGWGEGERERGREGDREKERERDDGHVFGHREKEQRKRECQNRYQLVLVQFDEKERQTYRDKCDAKRT